MVFRRYFTNPLWTYTGLDIVSGDNVDVVVNDGYKYPFNDNEFDIVICANVLEHVEDIYKLTEEIGRLSNGFVLLFVPWDRPLHNYPIDCWRMSPVGLSFLIKRLNKFNILECDFIKRDSYLIAKKYE